MIILGREYPSIPWNARCFCTCAKNIPFDELFFYLGICYMSRGFSKDGMVVVSPFENDYLFMCIDPFENVYYYSLDSPKCRDWLPPDLKYADITYCPF